MQQKFLIFSLPTLIISSVLSEDIYTNLCTTKECFTSGFLINQSMQIQTDPCENFYKFSCGDFGVKSLKPKHEIFWNRWVETEHLIKERLRGIIERKTNVKLNDVRRLYESCLENKEYVKDLILLVEILGNWPLIDRKWNEERFDWLFLSAEFVKLFKIYPMVKISVQIDHKNTTKYAIYLSTPNLILPKFILLNPLEHVTEIIAYKKWIFDTIAYMYPNENMSKLDLEVDEIIQFEIKLAKLIQSGQNKQKLAILKDLNGITKRNWTETLNVVFSGVDIRIFDKAYVYYTDYVANLFEFVKKTKKSTIANYMIWYVVKELSRDSSSVMKKLNFEIDRIILGVQSDVPLKSECILKLTQYVGYFLIQEYSKEYLKTEDILKVKRIAENVRTEFVRNLKKNKWLSAPMKRLVVEKILAVKFYVGHPDFEQIRNLCENVTITNNYFANILQLRRSFAQQNLKKLTTLVSAEWPENLFDVNAYYNVLQNSIIVPVGLLEAPFFHKDRPAVFNYAALGTLIGHELAHALDLTGRKADKNGNVKKWWGAKDVKMYNKRMECFERRYQKYGGHTSETIGETIADIVGVRLSYGAYVASRKVFGVVPFLETFSDDQIFFVTYAQLWCEISPKAGDILQEDEHAPAEIRVVETVRSNENFEKSFRCKGVSRKCPFW